MDVPGTPGLRRIGNLTVAPTDKGFYVTRLSDEERSVLTTVNEGYHATAGMPGAAARNMVRIVTCQGLFRQACVRGGGLLQSAPWETGMFAPTGMTWREAQEAYRAAYERGDIQAHVPLYWEGTEDMCPVHMVLYPSEEIYSARMFDLDTFLRRLAFASLYVRRQHMDDGCVALAFVIEHSPEVYTGY